MANRLYGRFGLFALIVCASATAGASDLYPAEMITQRELKPVDINFQSRLIATSRDSLFLVRNICHGSSDIDVDEYSTATLTLRQRVSLRGCGSVAGNAITALGADSARLYVKFGDDPESSDHVAESEVASKPDFLVFNRKTQKEITSQRVGRWIDFLDASGGDVLGCDCFGTALAMATHSCVASPKSKSGIMMFTVTDLNGAVACLGGSEARKAASDWVEEKSHWANGGPDAVNAIYAAAFRGTRFFDNRSPLEQLPVTLPRDGYQFASLGTGASAQYAAVTRHNNAGLEVALLDILTGRITQVAEVPAGKDQDAAIRLYADWLVIVKGDMLLLYHLRAPTRLYSFKTFSGWGIIKADLYGNNLLFRTAPADSPAVADQEQVFAIDLQLLTSPSFDCLKARSNVERLICSDKDLATADRMMAEAYSEAGPYSKDPWNSDFQPLAFRQRSFLGQRDECGVLGESTDNMRQCIAAAYAKRQQELDAIISGSDK